MFINLSNHGSQDWGEEQRAAAEQYGEIVDLPFPQIPVDIRSEEIDALVAEYLDKINNFQTDAIMVMGEFVFCFRLITALKQQGKKVLASTTERRVIELRQEDGTVTKTSEFVFCGFREY